MATRHIETPIRRGCLTRRRGNPRCRSVGERERAERKEKTKRKERAVYSEKPSKDERAEPHEKTDLPERVTRRMFFR